MTVLVFAASISACFGQAAYEPQILILSPYEMSYDKVFEKEIAEMNMQMNIRAKEDNDETKLSLMDNQPQNIKIMLQNEVAFTKTIDFSKKASVIAGRYLVYRFIERFPNLLITLKDIKCNGDIEALKSISREQHMQYVLNFRRVEFFKKAEISNARISVQLYDQASNVILLDKDYIGDWSNPGFDFSCEDSSLSCTICNALSLALVDVVRIVATNSPTLQQQRNLEQRRQSVLMNNYYSNGYDTTFLRKAVPDADSNINHLSMYQCLIDASKTKFLAFFLEKAVADGLNSLTNGNRDRNVNIISRVDITDPSFLDQVPQTYAYVVKGVKYNGKWYYQKSNVTYFEAKDLEAGREKFFNNLQQWGFFKERSTEFSPECWETNLFSKIKDLTKDPKWDRYGETVWDTEERENRDYIGMYEIVADEMKRMKRIKNEISDSIVSSTIIIPAYEAQMRTNVSNFSKYSTMYNKLILIYPKDRKVIINPIMITNETGEKSLHFYVVFADRKEVYEWTYFKPKAINKATWHYGSEVIDQLNTITKWNFSYTTLDDKKFWDTFVVAKKGGRYKYLKRLK